MFAEIFQRHLLILDDIEVDGHFDPCTQGPLTTTDGNHH